MNRLKRFFSTLWKILPDKWRWYLLWLFSDHFVVGVTGVVLNARDEVLLAHHVYRSGITWGLLGGGVKHREGFERAMHREILEETGLSVQVDDLLQVDLNEDHPLINLYFCCTVEGTPQPRVNEELFEAGFYSLDNLPGTVDPDQIVIIQRAQITRRNTADPPDLRTISTGTSKAEG
jgi:ADP-ribose pyrophosphatase YjhB (NUDIX family)